MRSAVVSLDEAGVCVRGVTGRGIAGLGLRSATSRFGEVTAGLGGVQSRWEGATELPLGRPSVPGSASPVGERVAFAWGTVSRVIEAGTGLAGVGTPL